MITDPASRPRRALVLGGGGALGRARHWGLAAGFLEAGIDLRNADLIVGTSAGAAAGSLLALGLDARHHPPPVDDMPAVGSSTAIAKLIDACARAAISKDPQAEYREIGRNALEATTVNEAISLARPTLAPLAGAAFPFGLRVTAVNAKTGIFKVWSAADGVPLERAVASSSALPGLWPPVTVGGGLYIDGAVRSMLNADLATEYDRVLVVSNFDLSATTNTSSSGKVLNDALRDEIESLRRRGATVELFSPDSDFLELSGHGTKMLNPLLAPQAFDNCRAQALREADRLRRLWTV